MDQQKQHQNRKLSDLLNKYNIEPDVISTLKGESFNSGFFNYVLIYLDREDVVTLDTDLDEKNLNEANGYDTVRSLHDVVEERLERIVSQYDKERFARSLSKRNLGRRFVDRNDYSFIISVYDDKGSKLMYRMSFQPLDAEKKIILWSTQDITKTIECDVLTGGLNRDGLLRNMSDRIKARPEGTEYAILYFNIAGLRRINEFYGTEVGDMVLQHFYAAMAYSDLMPVSYARSHSDSYYCLVPKERVDIQVIESLCRQEFKVAEKVLHYRLLCGIYFIPDYTEPITSLLGRARLALRYIKDPLKKPWVVLDEEMRRRCISDSEVVDQLDYALAHHEFVAYYQPIVNVRTERIEMAEALVRWNSSRYGFVAPGDFVPSLERNGEISRVDKFMEDHIYELQKERLSIGKSVVPIDINLSWVDFEDKSFVDQIEEHLNDRKVATELCRYEITESTIGELSENNHYLLDAFKNNKAKLIIDDFGKGYSFGTMSEIDFSIIKIDKSLIDNIGSKKADFLIESLINMFHKMNAKIIAEGVERLAQVEFLRRVGCDYIQGYYYYKPMPEDKFLELIDSLDQIKEMLPESELIQAGSMWMERDVLEAQYANLMQANESAKCLRTLLEEMGIFYFEWDIKTHIDTCSDKFREMYNLPSNEIPNMPEVADLCYVEDRDRFRDFYYRAERGELKGKDYFRLLSPDGNGYIWFRKTFYTLYDKDNKPFKVILTMQNCTDKYNYKALTQRNELNIFLQDIVTFKYTIDDDTFEFSQRGADGSLETIAIPNYLSDVDKRHGINQRILAPLINNKLQEQDGEKSGFVDYFDYRTKENMRAYYTVVESELGNIYAIVGHAESILKTREKLNETIQQQQEYIMVVDGLSKIYNAISLIDLLTGESKIILLDNAYDGILSSDMEWDKIGKIYADNVVEKEYRQKFLTFMNKDTLAARINTSRYISMEYIDSRLGWIRGFLIPSERDENGTPIRVLFASLPVGTEKSMMERLIYLSETDGLTQLKNRTSGERAIEVALRDRRSGTFALIDIDKFKEVNDTYGHAVGDELLIQTAECLKLVNPDGINMRLGGDEFAMYIYGTTTADKILELFSELFTKVEALQVKTNANPAISLETIHPTVSVGAIYYTGDKPVTFDNIYRSADELLYQSKRTPGCRITM